MHCIKIQELKAYFEQKQMAHAYENTDVFQEKVNGKISINENCIKCDIFPANDSGYEQMISIN